MPLHTAAAQDQPETLRLLLTHGADIAAVDNLVRTHLHCPESALQKRLHWFYYTPLGVL